MTEPSYPRCIEPNLAPDGCVFDTWIEGQRTRRRKISWSMRDQIEKWAKLDAVVDGAVHDDSCLVELVVYDGNSGEYMLTVVVQP